MNARKSLETNAPPSPMELTLSCLVAALEELNPGLSDMWVSNAESAALRSDIRRLHVKAPDPEFSTNMHEAALIAARVRFVVKAHARPKRKRG